MDNAEQASTQRKGELWKTIAFFFSYAKHSKSLLTANFSCQTVSFIYTAIQPLALSLILDKGVAEKNIKLIGIISLIIIIGQIVSSLADFFSEVTIAKIGANVSKSLRNDLYHQLQIIPFEKYLRIPQSQIIQTFSEYITNLQDTFILCTSPLLSGIAQSIVGLIILFWLAWPVALLVSILFAVLALAPNLFESRTQKALNKLAEKKQALLYSIQEYATANFIIRIFGLNNYWDKRVNKDINATQEAEIESNICLALTPQTLGFGSTICQLIVVVVGAILVIKGHLTLGLVFSMMIYANNFLGATTILSFSLPLLKKAEIARRNIEELFFTKQEYLNSPASTHLKPFPEIKQGIQLNHVSLTLDNHKILNDISVEIPLYSSVAFVGPSGSGKSTILRCLLGLLQPTSGCVLIDETYNTDSISPESFYEHVAIVTQDSLLFDMSIRENIRMGKLDASEEEIIIAAKQAGLYKDITNMPEELDTIIGEQGNRLSGGQRQRLALARALIRHPLFLILDEATSSLDAATEADINNNLLNYAVGTTLIIVTHRLNIAMSVDKIYFMNQGKVIEHGDHKTLMNIPNGDYSNLWKKQNSFSISNNKLENINLDFLRNIPIFKSCTDDILEKIIAQMAVETFEKDEIIFEQNSIGDKFYIIARGRVDVIKQNPDTKEKTIIAKLEDGDYFGELALLKYDVRTATIQTSETTTVLSLQFYQFIKIFADAPAVWDEIVKNAENREQKL